MVKICLLLKIGNGKVLKIKSYAFNLFFIYSYCVILIMVILMKEDALYYKDRYMKEFDSYVVDCINENGKIKVVLDNTCFYPEGGGAPSDVGFLNDIKVLHVELKNNTIYHEVEEIIEVGSKVHGVIDFDFRYSNMIKHSAEHIVSGFMNKLFKANNIGFHMDLNQVVLDFDVLIDKKQLVEVERLSNEVVLNNIEVKETIYSEEEIKNVNFRSKKELKGNVRIVEFADIDICACCGIHVSNTSEIRLIKLIKLERKGNGSRFVMLAGNDAINDYIRVREQVENVGTLLSKKDYEIVDGVNLLQSNYNSLKVELNSFKDMYMSNLIGNLKVKNKQIICVNNLDSNILRKYISLLSEKSKKIACIISDDRFILMCNDIDGNILLNDLKGIGIKAGLSNGIIQGKFSNCDLESYLNKY